MSAVFAGTFFYLALLNDDDRAHERAVVEAGLSQPIITAKFIFLELGNACAREALTRDRHFEQAGYKKLLQQ